MSTGGNEGLFDFLFGENTNQARGISEAGRLVKERLEQDREKAAQDKIEQAEERFQRNHNASAAYELGETYDWWIQEFYGPEDLARRKEIKRKLLRLLVWMDQNGIELGDAREVLRELRIEFIFTDAVRE